MHIHYQIKDSSGKIVNPQEWWANKNATSNSNPIDVKPIASPCLPITQADGKEFKDAKSLASILGSESNYLLGLNTWHGGIHISDKKAPWVKDIYPVRCMADGEVVAFRMMPDYLASNFKGQEYRYSNSFCLVRHHFKQPKSAEGNKGSTQKENSSEKGGSTEDNGFTYYTLYMHLCPWDKWPKNSRYRLRKGWRVRHSVPNHDYQPPALTLKAGEEFELVEGVTAQRGYVTGQGEFEFARIKVLSNGASSKEVLATKGMDSLWMAQDPSAIEKVGNIVRPMWVYDKIEARVKEDMVGRADPQAQKGKTGHYVAGESVFSVPAGSLISFDAHRCEWQEVRGRARRMARCVVQPLGRPVWLCVEEENIEIKRQEPTHLGKLYELPTPVPIRAGETIGYLGMYEAPTSTEGGMSSKHMVHIELFSDAPRAEAVVSSKEWKDKGFTLIDGSDSDGALDPAKIPPFFLNLYRHASDDKELKDNDLTVKKLENAVDSIENYDRVKGMVVKHSSEWWAPTSTVMMERFKSIFSEVTELPALISHEVDRVESTGWMHRLMNHRVEGPKVWHLHPFSLFEISVLSQRSGNLFTYADAEDALRIIFNKYGYDMAVVIERMYRDETGHFKSLQYKNCGTGGMEAFGNQPYYGWDKTFFEKNPSYMPIGTWSAFENKGKSGSGGNVQVTDRKKTFIKFPSVVAAMEYKVFYIKKHNGNWARWHNASDANIQRTYRDYISKINPKISNSLKGEK